MSFGTISIDPKNIHVLVVEDTETVRRMVVRHLQRLEYQVAAVENGQEALAHLRGSEVVDLVLLDQMLPDMEGLEVLRILLMEQEDPPPVIMMTAFGSLQLAVEFMKSGGADFLQKPFDMEVAHIKMLKALQRHSLQRDLTELMIEKKVFAESYQAKSEFLANISHEMLTPLHAILNFADFGISAKTEQQVEKIPMFFERIQESGKRLLALTENLLELSQTDANKFAYQMEKVDFTQLLKSVLQQLEEELAAKGLIVSTVNKKNQTLECELDPKRIEQVLLQVLLNAIQYSHEGGAILVELSEQEAPKALQEYSDKILEIAIKNEGVKIPKEELESIFDPFEQSSSTKTSARGRGLGLALCQKVVYAHSGKIWATSTETGVQIRFTLPKNAVPLNDSIQ